MRKYIGPKGYGAISEYGGSEKQGRYRMQSLQRLDERLTAAVKERILNEFAPYKADIKKIDKIKGHVRIWYNNHSLLYSEEI